MLLWFDLMWILSPKQSIVRDGTYVRPSHSASIPSYIARKACPSLTIVRPSHKQSPITLD